MLFKVYFSVSFHSKLLLSRSKYKSKVLGAFYCAFLKLIQDYPKSSSTSQGLPQVREPLLHLVLQIT